MTILSDIEALVQKAALESLSNDAKPQERLDALKILCPFYLAMSKGRNKDDGEDDEPSMSDIQNRLRIVENEDGSDPAGSVPSRGHRRTGSE